MNSRADFLHNQNQEGAHKMKKKMAAFDACYDRKEHFFAGKQITELGPFEDFLTPNRRKLIIVLHAFFFQFTPE